MVANFLIDRLVGSVNPPSDNVSGAQYATHLSVMRTSHSQPPDAGREGILTGTQDLRS